MNEMFNSANDENEPLEMEKERKRLIIQSYNDTLRTKGEGGQIVATHGIMALSRKQKAELFGKMKSYSEFPKEDDPYGEHDMGFFSLSSGERINWKIDYYDESYEMLSPDASDPDVTNRVLTVMLSSEY